MVPQGMAVDAELCGWTLARARRAPATGSPSPANLGSGSAFDRAMVRFAHRATAT